MDTFAVRLKWEGNPVAIVFRVDNDYFKGPARVGWPNSHLLEKDEKTDRLLVWVKGEWVYVTGKDIW